MPISDYPKQVTIDRDLLEAMGQTISTAVGKSHVHARLINEITHPPRAVVPVVDGDGTAHWRGEWSEADVYDGMLSVLVVADKDKNLTVEISLDEFDPEITDKKVTITLNGTIISLPKV
jgi:hypothetical protein